MRIFEIVFSQKLNQVMIEDFNKLLPGVEILLDRFGSWKCTYSLDEKILLRLHMHIYTQNYMYCRCFQIDS